MISRLPGSTGNTMPAMPTSSSTSAVPVAIPSPKVESSMAPSLPQRGCWQNGSGGHTLQVSHDSRARRGSPVRRQAASRSCGRPVTAPSQAHATLVSVSRRTTKSGPVPADGRRRAEQ
ncbi:hypothetical protein GCM10027060_25230 [Nesterenkonia halophila]